MGPTSVTLKMENCNAFIALRASVVLLCFGVLNVVAESSHAAHEDIKLEGTPTPSIAFGETRTGYHFQPPQNWINDPNGPMYYNGIYHLFYQYNPKGAVWQDGIIWGHSVSTDLINWTPLEPAIRPSKPFDHAGCWSGSATIISGNKPVILYTGIDSDKRQVQNIVVPKNLSDPYLREWIKPDRNPLIVPTGWINSSAFRDPTTAWSGPDGYWRVAIGSKHNSRGMAILYRSKDFENWVKVKHPLHSVKGSGMWECPDFYPVSSRGKKGCNTSGSECGKGTKHVFKVSLDMTRYEYYTIGTYSHETDRYRPDNTSVDDHTGLRYDYGNFYASKTFFDAKKNRRVLWGWSNESDLASNDVAKGWAGIQTIPRALWLDSNGRQLVQWPVEELETFRGKLVRMHDTLLESGELREVPGVETAQADVEVIFEVQSLEKAEPFNSSWSDPQELCELKPANVTGGIGPFGLLVLASKSLEEQTAVFFRVFKDLNKHVVLMCQDPTRSSLRPEVYKPIYGGFVDMDIANREEISLRSLIDHSVVESFGGGGRTCITSRIYPQVAAGSAAHLYVFNNGTTSLKISELIAWEMREPRINS